MSHHWIKIFDNQEALQNNVPKGKVQAITVNGTKICLAHSNAGFFAVADKCPHNGVALSGGHCSENNEIVCPMHRYPFNLENGRSTSGLAMNVETFPLQINNEGVFIGIRLKWWEH